MLKNWHKQLMILLFIGIVANTLMNKILPIAIIGDEFFHFPQIILFKSSNYLIFPYLTMPPTYHLVVGKMAQVLEINSLSEIRVVSAGISFMSVILAWTFLNFEKSKFSLLQSIQLFASPLLWPMYWVLYTDIPSLIPILLSLILFIKNRYLYSSVICLLSLFFRQHNIFWVILIWIMAIDQSFYLGRYDYIFKKSEKYKRSFFKKIYEVFRIFLRSTGPYLIPISGFLIFIYLNNGIALGERHLQKFDGIYPLQIFSFIFVLGLVLLPLHLSNLQTIFLIFKRHYWIATLFIVVLFFLFMKTFKINHPYNFPSDYFLRNWLLYYLDGHFWLKVASFGLITLSLLSIIATPLRYRANYWLYPITMLALLPVSLIEQRYYIIPFTLFMLFRKPKSLVLEIVLLSWFIVLSSGITWGMVTMKFFI